MMSYTRILKLTSTTLFILLILTIQTSSILSAANLVSARKFAITNGIAYQWFPIQKMLVMRQGLKSVRLRVDNPIAIVDRKDYPLPTSPQIRDGQIMIPGEAVARIFRGLPPQTDAPLNKPLAVIVYETPPASELLAKPPTLGFPKPVLPPNIQTPVNSTGDSVLVALRHSARENHTRVVLEFSGNILYKVEHAKNLFKLQLSGCKNLIPTRRTNPIGRGISNIHFNSGPNRSGLIISFSIPENTVKPSIETVGNPFRMIISFPSSKVKQIATVTTELKSKVITTQVKKITVIKMEKAPEISIVVPVASITNSDFLARTIVIDAGHGGADQGTVILQRPFEKDIVFSVSTMLKQCLEKMGMKAVLIRTADVNIPQEQRRSIANRLGSDLFISLHTGGSVDQSKSGPACYLYEQTKPDSTTTDKSLSYTTIYNEWQSSTRFDLAYFLAKKINSRLVKHLQVKSRGIKKVPMLPLKLIVCPAVLIEIGMLSETTEGKNLISKVYQKAIAQSIANGVIDFFNGIVIKQ